MEITLEELLAARDARTAYIARLQKRFPSACVAVLTVISPGKVKKSAETKRLFDAGIAVIGRLVMRCELVPLVFEAHEKDTGDEMYLVVKIQPGFLKMEFCKLEESAPYGRLWDMDVVKPGGARISREDIGFGERKCIVCGKPGRACYSRRLHTEEEVQTAYRKLLQTLPE
jgi:holo-ACP synthase CitX